MSCSSAVQSVIDIDVTRLTPALATDSRASSGRKRAAGDAGDEGDSGDVIGEMSGRAPSDLSDAANKGYRATVSTSTSNQTQFGDSCSDGR